jgi:hypothetical protein
MIFSDSKQLRLIVDLFITLIYPSHATIQILGIVAGCEMGNDSYNSHI